MAKVLVVDDARVMRFHITKLLKELGHEVTAEAKDGFEALQEYKKNRPDLVTMDLEMPTVNGIVSGIGSVVELIRFDSKALIIMVSSKTDKDNVTDALKKGATNYIYKPVTSSKLKHIIEDLGL